MRSAPGLVSRCWSPPSAAPGPGCASAGPLSRPQQSRLRSFPSARREASAGPSAADAAIIRHALLAITAPANAIVHVKETGVQDGTPVAAEWWQQTSPPHALRMIKGSAGRETEAANDGATSFQYDAGTNTVVETPASSAPGLVDPIAGVRAQLARRGARVAGTATIDGTRLYEIELPTGVVAYFDTTDFRPVYLDNPQRDGSVVRTRVVTYEELPMTADNAKLLSTTAQHPDARVSPNAGDLPPSRGYARTAGSAGSAGSGGAAAGRARPRSPATAPAHTPPRSPPPPGRRSPARSC